MTNRDIFRDNFNKLLKINGKLRSEVADDLAFPRRTLYDWAEGNTFPRPEALQKIANYFDVSVARLMASENDEIVDVKIAYDVIEIPVYSSVSCGEPNKIDDDNIVDYEYVANTKQNKKLLGVKANGDSMLPKIESGDTLLIHPMNSIYDLTVDDICVLKINGGEYTCKYIVKQGDSIILTSTNSIFKPIIITKEQIENDKVYILGRVVKIIRKNK